MTHTDLIDQLRETIVLNGPDAWQTSGYLNNAQAVGWSLPEAEKRAAEVVDEVAKNSVLFANINARIARMALPSRSQYRDQDTAQIINAARSLNLSPNFVKDRWIPAELAKIAPPPTPPDPAPVTPVPPAPAQEPVTDYDDLLNPDEPAQLQPAPAVTPTTETTESMRRKVTDSLNEYSDFIPAPAIRSLFRTISYNEVDLSVAIWNYLQINQYEAVTEPASGSLREQLTSTDWRVVRPEPALPPKPPQPEPTPEPVYVPPILSEPIPPIVRSFTATPARVKRGQPVTLEWEVENLLAVTIDDLGEGLSPKNRGWIKPKKTADYTLFDVNNNPLSTVKVEVIQPDRSGLYGVLFALVLLLLIYWFVRGSASGNRRDAEHQPTEQPIETLPERTDKNTTTTGNITPTTTEPVAETTSEPTPETNESVATDTRNESKPESVAEPIREPAPEPTTPANALQGKYEEAFGDKPYDKVELGSDERGWRRARIRGRWGFIDASDNWVINPEYSAITPFKGNTAAVFLNGQLITIDRNGQQVRN